MFYHLSAYLVSYFTAFNLVRYVSFRAIASLLSTLLFTAFFGDRCILYAQRRFRSPSRAWTPESHRQKDDMPTMGGVFILAQVIINILLWCNLLHPYVWTFCFCLMSFGTLGALDDWYKIHAGAGISARCKFLLQCLFAALTAFFLWYFGGISTDLYFPFFKNFHPNLGWLFLPWVLFVLVSISNAVNLTDGLDGLAIGSLLPNFSLFALLAFLGGNFLISTYLHIPFANTGEVAVIGSILFGASLGFLWYNAYPAQIFMGDVGSLALGAGLGLIAIMTKQELLLPLSGGLFVLETVSVIVQVLSFRYLGKRFFKMAPIHHHYELLGWQESKITVRFAIISFVLCLCALITLKIR